MTAPAPAQPIQIPTLCERHRHDLIVRRLKIREDEPWLATEVTAQLLLFGRAAADPRITAIAQGTTEGLRIAIGGIRCLACFDPEGYRRAVRLLRKGLPHAAKVARGEARDPDWPTELTLRSQRTGPITPETLLGSIVHCPHCDKVLPIVDVLDPFEGNDPSGKPNHGWLVRLSDGYCARFWANEYETPRGEP